MKTNDIGRYTKPGKGEGHLRFSVVEVNGDRVQICCINSGLAFPPVETVRPSDIELVKGVTA